MPYVKSKAWGKSRTVWLGVLAFALGAQALLTDTPLLGDYTEAALTAVGVLIVALRARTTQPLAAHPTQDGGAVADGVPGKTPR